MLNILRLNNRKKLKIKNTPQPFFKSVLFPSCSIVPKKPNSTKSLCCSIRKNFSNQVLGIAFHATELGPDISKKKPVEGVSTIDSDNPARLTEFLTGDLDNNNAIAKAIFNEFLKDYVKRNNEPSVNYEYLPSLSEDFDRDGAVHNPLDGNVDNSLDNALHQAVKNAIDLHYPRTRIKVIRSVPDDS
jgi:hypothetical protein